MKINQQYIKNTNMKQLYQLLKDNTVASRAYLAKKTGLSKTTVSSLIDELIQRGFVADNGAALSTMVGRKPNHLSLTGEKHCVAAIYWESEEMTGALVCLDGAVLNKQTLALGGTSQYNKCLRQLFEALLEKRNSSCEIIGLCIILPAMIDKKNKKILSTILSLENETSVIENIRTEFEGFPIAFFNDTACMAYAEKPHTKQEENTFTYVNLDQGIGAALFVDGKILGGASGTKTQFGHYSVDANGMPCSCGNRGCLEVTIGERALDRLVREYGGSTALKEQKTLSYLDIGSAALGGDFAAQRVIRYIAENLAVGLSNLISLFRPEKIILGGSGKGLGTPFLEELTHTIKSHGFQKMVEEVQISYSALGDDACFIGAMEYYFDNCFCFTADSGEQIFLG
ncbi:ROK family transcriptional regulator [Anaerocolumna xylanovorans]|uniref:Sugar kinase of the NBD/HSP70 family, may contain an N-terminal HTH domain n=1 Tax=Anaerocolumna xylanovorans DSM 12503 TaxID=1121345 RepID=A0A1M7YN88_9FIRM|nr:ROK family transcriptional regulator [Anaerocolumna xylanovorans]SHO54047.1 Sugar kinase of the NBD/HSP70 family, may contain an N-terminal HTH domain [Anaerocolumna xylanovorans DSM 12503]